MATLKKAKEKVQQSGKKTREILHHHGIAIPGWIQVLIWAIGVAVFFGLTMTTLKPILSKYFNEDQNVAIQTSILINERFPPPQFVMRVPHHLTEKDKALGRISDHLLNGTDADCFECQQLANASWDVWREINISKNDYYDVYHSLTAAFMRKLLSNSSIESDFDALNGSNSEWNAPVVDAALNFLIWRHGLDRYFKPQFDSSGNEIASVDSDYANRTFILQLLHSRVINALCHRMTLRLRYDWLPEERTPPKRFCTDLLINNTLPVIIDRDALWVHLESSNGLEARFDCRLLPHNTTNISMWTPSAAADNVDRVWLYADPLPLYFSEIDYGTNHWWYVLAGGDISNGKLPLISTQYSVSMRTKEKRQKKRDKCYVEISPKICVEKCTKRWTIEHCNCVPFTFNKGLPPGEINGSVPFDQLPYCNDRAYNICDPMAFSDADRQRCFEECADPCEYTSYNFVIQNDEYVQDSYPSFTFTLRPITSDPVVQFSNATKDDSNELVSQVGGVVGLYLGLTALSLLTFLINVIDFGQQYYRKKADARKRKTWAMSLFRMAAMNRLLMHAAEKDDTGDGDAGCSVGGETNEETASVTDQIKMIKNVVEQLKSEMAMLRSGDAKNDSRLVHKLHCDD